MGTATIIKLARPTSRLFLSEVDEGYGPDAYFDVRLGLTVGEQRRLQELNQFIDHEQFERTQIELANEIALKTQTGEIKPVPPVTEAFREALLKRFTVHVVATNITADAEGKPLPTVTEPKFWEAVGQDVKDAISVHINAQSVQRVQRVSGQDFTRKPAGS